MLERMRNGRDVARSSGRPYLALAVAAGAALLLATPTRAQTPEQIYDSGNFPTSLAQFEVDANPTGTSESYSPAGGISDLSKVVFFQPLGSNGRSCATCHQPPSAWGLSLSNIRARYTATGGLDPAFATIDGATCPINATSRGQPTSAYSLLLNQGLFRAPIALPDSVQFTVKVLSDPYGCNTNPAFNQTVDPATGKKVRVISIYRRPSPTANLAFVINPVPAEIGAKIFPPAINWDGRADNLEDQANEAVKRHFELPGPLSADQISQMASFEASVFSAQISDNVAGSLTGGGAHGGPVNLAETRVGQFAKLRDSLAIYFPWSKQAGGNATSDKRLSVFRGEEIFNTRTFLISNVEGIPNQVNQGTCEFCHSQVGAADDPTGTRFLVGVGVDGSSQAFGGPAPSPLLPVFELTCKGTLHTQHHGQTMITTDPGRALTTGKCFDIGKFKIPPLRGLAARAPYFFNGSAATLADVVNFYDTRFNIGLSAQDKEDLTNFLSEL
jgi:cytochrome c peroxidase